METEGETTVIEEIKILDREVETKKAEVGAKVREEIEYKNKEAEVASLEEEVEEVKM